MTNKFIIVLFSAFFSCGAYSTSSFSDVTMKGFYDNDTTLDRMACDQSSKGVTTCRVVFSNAINKKLSYKNKYCSDMSLENPKVGQLILHCGVWGEDTSFYFSWSFKFNDLILDKKVVETLAMNGPDSNIESRTIVLRKYSISIFDTDRYLGDK